MTDNNLKDLCQELQGIYSQWLEKCHAAGLAVKAIVTWRSSVDQNAAKTNGLSNASAGQSPHNCCNDDGSPNSKAFDFAIFDEDAHYITDGTDTRYEHAGKIGESLGLIWGGSWHHPDYDHLEMADWKE